MKIVVNSSNERLDSHLHHHLEMQHLNVYMSYNNHGSKSFVASV
jgi:hypothetical protein